MKQDLKIEQPATIEPLDERLGDDLLWGIKGIADFIGKTERQAFHLASTRAIPTGKVGHIVVASRRRLREHFRALLGADQA
jgi:hypothetical protein